MSEIENKIVNLNEYKAAHTTVPATEICNCQSCRIKAESVLKISEVYNSSFTKEAREKIISHVLYHLSLDDAEKYGVTITIQNTRSCVPEGENNE